MPRKNHSGWFVEVPTELKQEFQRLYKGRSAMRKLTVAAIEWAIKVRPTLNPQVPNANTHREEAVRERSGETLLRVHLRNNEGAERDQEYAGPIDESQDSSGGS